MAKFDYKKWVIENKYGKINEQILEEPTVYVGCGLCGENSTAPGIHACLPGIEFTIQPDQLNYDLVQSNSDLYMLQSSEIIGGMESIGMGEGYRLYGPQAVQYLDYYCASGSAVTTEPTGSYDPFCCDINAINFGQTANGQPYGTNPGEPEQYLMINGPQGDMCDNSICQGNVNQPDSIGDPPGPEGQGIPQPIATLGKDKLPFKRKKRRLRRRNRRLREVKNSIKKEIKKLRK